MQHTSLSDQPCPVACALEVVGEWWTLLHEGKGHQVSVRVYCDDCGRVLDADESEAACVKPMATGALVLSGGGGYNGGG